MSWLEEHLPDALKEALCEPDAPAAVSAHQPTAMPVQFAITNPVIAPALPSNFPAIRSDQSSAVASILSDLRSKTNFDATPVGQQLKESLDALADSGMSEEKMAKTAMKLSKQSPTQVVAVLQTLQTALVADKQQFEASMQKATAAEVNARQEKSAQLRFAIQEAERNLETLRQNKSEIDVELQDKQNKISSARANYAAASEARNTEITDMISHYQSIPEGK